MTLRDMKQYFPDSYPKGRSCNRDYFFCILATVHPEYFAKLVRNSKDQRLSISNEEQKKKAIVITQEWSDNFTEFPQYCKKKGRMIYCK